LNDVGSTDFTSVYEGVLRKHGRVVVDANILIFALVRDFAERAYCRPIVDDLVTGKLNAVIPVIVLAETYHKCVFKYKMDRDELEDFIKDLAGILPPENIPALDLATFLDSLSRSHLYQLLPFDAAIVSWMESHRVTEIISNNKDFDRARITRLDPIPQTI
jgi:predicted nucleic acid-binding protein